MVQETKECEILLEDKKHKLGELYGLTPKEYISKVM